MLKGLNNFCDPSALRFIDCLMTLWIVFGGGRSRLVVAAVTFKWICARLSFFLNYKFWLLVGAYTLQNLLLPPVYISRRPSDLVRTQAYHV